MGKACSIHGRGEKCTKALVGKPKTKRPSGKPGSRWEDNLKIYLKGRVSVVCGLDSSGSGQGQ
jgi:hypothetical protein